MSPMDGMDEADLAFERLLLDSAREDALPEVAVAEAWKAFAASSGVTTIAASEPFARALHSAALRWVIVGAAFGGGATAAWFSAHRSDGVSGAASTPTVRVEASRATPERTEPPPEAVVPPSDDAPVAAPRARAKRPANAPKHVENRHRTAPTASLLEQVAALDAVRTAMAIGDFDSAVRQVDEYHATFRGGELAPDAEVLAVEALARAGKAEEARRRAKRFLARYPSDPHAPRVAEIAR